MREINSNKALAYINGALTGLALYAIPADNSLKYISQAALLPATITADDSYYNNMKESYISTFYLLSLFQMVNLARNFYINDVLESKKLLGLGTDCLTEMAIMSSILITRKIFEPVEEVKLMNIELPTYHEIPVLGHNESFDSNI